MNKIGNFNREIEVLTKIQMEILKLKNPISNLKKSFYGLNSRLEITEELMNLRKNQWKLPTMKNKGKKDS